MNEFLEQINSLNNKLIADLFEVLTKEEKIYISYCEKQKKILSKNNVFLEKIENEILELLSLKTENYNEIKKILDIKKIEYAKIIEENLVNESADSEIKKFQKVKGMSIKAIREPLKRKIHEVESYLTILEKDFTSKKKDIKIKKDEAKRTFKSKSLEIKRRNDKELIKLNKELDAEILPLEQELSPEKDKKRIVELKRDIKRLRIKGYKNEKSLKIKTLKEKELLEKESMTFYENIETELKVLELYYERRGIDLKSQKKILQLEIDCELDLYDHKSTIKSYENIKNNYFENIDRRVLINDEVDQLKKNFLDTKNLEETEKILIYNKANEKFLETQTLLLEGFAKFNTEILNKNILGINILKNTILKQMENNHLILEKTLLNYYDYKNKFLLSFLETVKTIKSNIVNYDSFDLSSFLKQFTLEINVASKNQKLFLNEFKIELKTAFKEISRFIVEKYDKIISLHKLSLDNDFKAADQINKFSVKFIENIKNKNLQNIVVTKDNNKLMLDNIKLKYLDTINELDLLKSEFASKCFLEITNHETVINDKEKKYLLAKGKEIIEKGNILLENDKKEYELKLANYKKIFILDKEITHKHNAQIIDVEKNIIRKIKLL